MRDQILFHLSHLPHGPGNSIVTKRSSGGAYGLVASHIFVVLSPNPKLPFPTDVLLSRTRALQTFPRILHTPHAPKVVAHRPFSRHDSRPSHQKRQRERAQHKTHTRRVSNLPNQIF